MSNDHEPEEPLTRGFSFDRGVLAFTLLALAIGWTVYGAIYYQRVLPFFDSVAYQESFVRIVGRTGEVGIWQSLWGAWFESSNVALFRLWAALCGRMIPAANEGLYLYIYGIHFIATGLLVWTVSRASALPAIGVFAAAAWLAACPFAETVNGVLDQRMDLASGSFCLAVTALFFDWSDKPSRWSAGFAGLAVALAVLHRPVMAVTVAAIALVFVTRALLRHRARRREWVLEVAWMLLPRIGADCPVTDLPRARFALLLPRLERGGGKRCDGGRSSRLQSCDVQMVDGHILPVVDCGSARLGDGKAPN